MVKILGYELKRAEPQDPYQSFSPPVKDDGAVNVAAGGAYGTYIDLEGTVRNEAELINKYRQMSLHPEVDWAINQITNEAIVVTDEQDTVELLLDDIEELPDNIKKIVTEEFKEVQRLLEFSTHSYDIFRRFYTDGRLPYHAIIDSKRPELGIQELRYVDPRKLRKIRELEPKSEKSLREIPGSEMVSRVKQEYFVYNAQGFSANQYLSGFTYTPPTQGIKIANDAMVYITSGLMDGTGTTVLSWLHKAIKPLNALSSLEDAAIVYRLARAPERRIFYIDVSGLPRHKAEQHIRDMMTRYKNKLVYDQQTGEVRDDRKFMTMLEDFWFPRRGDNKATEIDTLPGADATNIMEEVEYFLQKLMNALNVPYARTHPEEAFPLGPRATEISRDEVTFSKFIDRLRVRFNQLFLQILEKQLVLKRVMTPEDWKMIAHKIKFKYARDNLYAEIKEREVINERLNTLTLVMPFVGRYFSNRWVVQNILNQDDDDIEQMRDEILEETQDPIWNPPMPPMPPDGEMGAPGTIPQTSFPMPTAQTPQAGQLNNR